jgi:hypothetical protein
MGSPNWSKIPFDKMPQWKKEEILAKSRKDIQVLENDLKTNLTCDVCQREAKSLAGLVAHKRSHK